MGQVLAESQERLVEVEATGRERPEPAPVGEQKTFRSYDPEQVLLMAPVLNEWVPEGDLAHFVSDLVDTSLELSEIYASYESERGYPPYDPRLMLKLVIYGYANGICSSRKLEQATHRDVAVRMLCAGQHPDYRSIARFRARHLDALSELFVQALRLCAEAGLVKLGRLALDGTKLIWRAVCQGCVVNFSHLRVGVGGGCGRLGGWRSGRLCATRGQTDIRGFGVAAGPWFVVGSRCLRSGVASPQNRGGGLLIVWSRIPRALPGRHRPSRRDRRFRGARFIRSG